MSQGDTHNWEVDSAIGQEIVVQSRKKGATAGEEFNSGVHVYGQSGTALNNIDELLLLLLKLVGLDPEMLHHLIGAIEAGERRNIVERSVCSERRRVRSCQELLVGGLESHAWILQIDAA